MTVNHIAAARLAHIKSRTHNDTGTTLIELVVAMTIMTIFLTIFTGAMLSMFRSVNKVEGITDTSAQVSMALNRLDSTLRYASAISPPPTDVNGNPSASADGNWYVAFQSTYTGSTVCTQLRLNTTKRQLQQRTWSVSSGGAAEDITAWRPLASQIEPVAAQGNAVPPFKFHAADGSILHEQLRVRFAAVTGGGNQTTTSISDVIFTAFNATLNTPTDGICQEVSSS